MGMVNPNKHKHLTSICKIVFLFHGSSSKNNALRKPVLKKPYFIILFPKSSSNVYKINC